MFNSNNKKPKESAFTNDTFSANTIQTGTSIEGNIKSDGSIRIDGILKGSISTKAKLVVGKTGVITGDVNCQNASVEGKIEGQINVQGLLDVKTTGFLEGDIFYSKLVVEEGAKLIGRCAIVNANKASLSGKGSFEHKKAV